MGSRFIWVTVNNINLCDSERCQQRFLMKVFKWRHYTVYQKRIYLTVESRCVEIL